MIARRAASSRRAAAVTVAACTCTVAACADRSSEPQPQVTSLTERASTSATPSPPTAGPGEGAGEGAASQSNKPDLQSVVESVTSSFGGQLGIAAAGAGGVESSGLSFATPAWSTIKVPLSIAAMRQDPSLYPSVSSAITLSDNAAAEGLYQAVGPDAVNEVLAKGGIATPLNTAPLRPGFSTFGQTSLTPAEEAVFAGSAACLRGAGEVLGLMGEIDPSQAWGLGEIGGSMYKGGWGPDEAGAYQVRQLGLIPRGDGTYAAVALTALPADGAFATGEAMLTAAARALDAPQLPPAACQP